MQILKATKREIYEAKTLAQLRALGARCGWKFGAAEKIHKWRQNGRVRKSDRRQNNAVAEATAYKDESKREGSPLGQMDIFTERPFDDNRSEEAYRRASKG